MTHYLVSVLSILEVSFVKDKTSAVQIIEHASSKVRRGLRGKS